MIGPHRGGRSTAVAGVPGDRRTFYMGAAGGGVWKTTDAGEVWDNVSDGFFKAGSVGAIGIAASNPNVVYVGTGSACIRNNVSIGIGMYRSADGGTTWQPAGLADAGQIARVRVDPHEPDLVYVAALGHAFGPNATRGVFRSRDGGRSWQRVLSVDDRTGAADLAMDARNPRVLYAAMWTGERRPWGLVGGSSDGGVFKTTDGGDHWTRLTSGLPAGPVGRIGVAVSPARPGRVWALVDAADGGLFRSDDGGQTFKRTNADRQLTSRSWYYAHVFADTRDPDVVYIGNTNLYRSTDGGTTFSPIPMPHGDNHDLWIDPQDPRVLIEGNDGGATISVDGGKSWSTQLNQPTAEMYRVAVDEGFPYRVYGAQQDQYDALSVPSRTANFGARLQLQHWYAVGGMEGGFVALDPRTPDVVYAGGPSGMITRFDRRSMHLRGINVYPETGGDPRYRFTWNAPIVTSPLEPDAIYHTSQYVHRSTDGGQSWAVISPDLTRGDKSRHSMPAGTVSPERMPYPTVSAFDESPVARGVLWAGSDDGLVHVSRDGGANWTDVTPGALPEGSTVNAIDPSRHDAGRAFVAAFRYQLDDFRPFVFRTDDYGQHWTLLTDGRNGIPADQFVRVVREDPVRKGLLYAGTEFGVFVSLDDGGHWQSLQLNLPATPVTDIAVHKADLVLSTNGRSFWILDDVSPLRELAVETPTAAHLFGPRDVYRVATSAEEDDQPYVGGACCVSNPRDIYAGARIERHRLGEEPPDGAIVYVALPKPPAGRVALDILGPDGRVVRSLVDSTAAGGNPESLHAGLNRIVWDLRVNLPSQGPRGPVALPGPKAVPGTYEVQLTADGRTQRASFHVLSDPRLRLSVDDYQRQFDLLLQVAGGIDRLQRAARTERGASAGRSSSGALERQLTSLYGFVSDSEDRPTASAEQRWAELKREVDEFLKGLRVQG
ncbi:MAG: WD40/YVTN/BNR-like repeat-containing protein [Betaproteobacteria bacterium]